ncbi:MAG: hypothetical protein WAS50_05565, partial [Nitrospira sp.]
EPDKDFIMRRRAIAEDYWVNKPQLERIGMFMIATSVAFLGVGASIWIGWSYLLLITAILLNEITMYRWRKQRNLSLDIIDDAQIQRNRERIRKTLPNVPPEG